MTTIADDTHEVLTSDETADPHPPVAQGVRRFTAVVVGATLLPRFPTSGSYGTSGPAEWTRFGSTSRGRFPGLSSSTCRPEPYCTVTSPYPKGSIGLEAFIHDGRTYSYFGILPSLIRMPLLLFTHSFDGRLSAPSLLLAWVVTAVFSSLLL